MQRVLTWFAGLVGLAALGRALRRRRQPADVLEDRVAPPVAAGDPAAELRRTLAAQRPPDAGTAPVTATETLDERRARVHAKAREAMDAMHDNEGPAA